MRCLFGIFSQVFIPGKSKQKVLKFCQKIFMSVIYFKTKLFLYSFFPCKQGLDVASVDCLLLYCVFARLEMEFGSIEFWISRTGTVFGQRRAENIDFVLFQNCQASASTSNVQ